MKKTDSKPEIDLKSLRNEDVLEESVGVVWNDAWGDWNPYA